jgi:hypothetical protein
MKNLNVKHKYDMCIEIESNINTIDRATYFVNSVEPEKDDGGFDCAGTVGTFGTAGGCAGTFGTFGCCC